jgi:hypothetical protein
MWTLQNDATRSRFIGLLGVCCGLMTLSACMKQPEPAATTPATTSNASQASELEWARAALKRNPSLEVIAIDTAAGVFTIKLKDSGAVQAVKLSELAAAPVSTLTTQARTAAAMPEPQTAAKPAAAEAKAQSPSSPTTAAASDAPSPTSNYTIQRTGGQLTVSGPGVSIVSSGTAAAANTTGEGNQRSADPIICEGRRMLHFDNRDIYVAGDAIIARGGCELYITNSRVIAEGTGVIVDDAVVHIANSTIQGNAASFDASDYAKVYVRDSTFQGLSRRAERAVVQDQGGNQWR